MSERVLIFMPKLGHATGEMPHLRNPPKNWMPGQNLYYLYTACRNLGCEVLVVDGNWSKEPVQQILDFAPHKVLISSATPTFEDTLSTTQLLRQRGYNGPIYIGGPHVSLNTGWRDWLLPELENVTYVPLVSSTSTFDWVPTVFPERSPLEVLGLPEADAKQYLIDAWTRDSGKPPRSARLQSCLFSYFVPSIDWMKATYEGEHIRDEMKSVPLRRSIITSIGCSKTCSFCGNPYIYQIGFKRPEVVRQILQDYKSHGIDRLSIHDMFFAMYLPHTTAMMDVFREESVTYSMQTCLENLTDDLLTDLKASGMQKFLVGIENPVSYSVGKTVELDKLRWLLDQIDTLELAGVKLSYIVGLPGVSLQSDLELLRHIVQEVLSRQHPLEDLQVNLYTPYRPESDTSYRPYGSTQLDAPPLSLPGNSNPSQHIQILTRLPFSYWGSFPVGIANAEDFWRQMVLCDTVYDVVYSDFRQPYLDLRERYLQDIMATYPDLAPYAPSFQESRNIFRTTEQQSSALSH